MITTTNIDTLAENIITFALNTDRGNYDYSLLCCILEVLENEQMENNKGTTFSYLDFVHCTTPYDTIEHFNEEHDTEFKTFQEVQESGDYDVVGCSDKQIIVGNGNGSFLTPIN